MTKSSRSAQVYEPVDLEFLTLDMGLSIDTKARQVDEIKQWTGIRGNILPGKSIDELNANEVAAVHLIAHYSFIAGVKSVGPIEAIRRFIYKLIVKQ